LPRLLNLGSLCIDRVYQVDKIATAGETVSSKSFAIYPGGKGANQSLAAAKAGADVYHHGCLGEDGAWLIDVLCDGGVNADGVFVLLDGETGHAVIQVDEAGQNSIVIAGGTNRRISLDMMEKVVRSMQDDDWLLLQNEINDLETVLELSAKHRGHVAFNVAPVDGREQNYDLANVEILIVNEIEAGALSATSNPIESLEVLCTRYPDTHVVLTEGADGLRYGLGSLRHQLPAFKVQAVDETAAGDAFIGYFMASVLRGDDMLEAIQHGSIAGAYAVTKPGAGVSIPTTSQFKEFKKTLS